VGLPAPWAIIAVVPASDQGNPSWVIIVLLGGRKSGVDHGSTGHGGLRSHAHRAGRIVVEYHGGV